MPDITPTEVCNECGRASEQQYAGLAVQYRTERDAALADNTRLRGSLTLALAAERNATIRCLQWLNGQLAEVSA